MNYTTLNIPTHLVDDVISGIRAQMAHLAELNEYGHYDDLIALFLDLEKSRILDENTSDLIIEELIETALEEADSMRINAPDAASEADDADDIPSLAACIDDKFCKSDGGFWKDYDTGIVIADIVQYISKGYNGGVVLALPGQPVISTNRLTVDELLLADILVIAVNRNGRMMISANT